VRCYRLCQIRFRALDGQGARKYGGRWNRPGRPAVYASSSRALAILELLARVDREIPADLLLLTINIPDAAPIERLRPDTLPTDWLTHPAPESCRIVGDDWLASAKGLVLAVPSVLVPEESNLLLNPEHAKFATVRVVAGRPFSFDPRLVR